MESVAIKRVLFIRGDAVVLNRLTTICIFQLFYFPQCKYFLTDDYNIFAALDIRNVISIQVSRL